MSHHKFLPRHKLVGVAGLAHSVISPRAVPTVYHSERSVSGAKLALERSEGNLALELLGAKTPRRDPSLALRMTGIAVRRDFRRSVINLVPCLALFSSLTFWGARLSAQDPGRALQDPAVEARVDALLKQMTPEEKVGQLIQRDAGGGLTGPGRGGSGWDALAARGEVGSLFNLTSPPRINAVRKAAG